MSQSKILDPTKDISTKYPDTKKQSFSVIFILEWNDIMAVQWRDIVDKVFMHLEYMKEKMNP